MVPSLQATQTTVLTDQNSDLSVGGLAGISGNGAQFYQATQTSELDLVFENVARSLVQLVHWPSHGSGRLNRFKQKGCGPPFGCALWTSWRRFGRRDCSMFKTAGCFV